MKKVFFEGTLGRVLNPETSLVYNRISVKCKISNNSRYLFKLTAMYILQVTVECHQI